MSGLSYTIGFRESVVLRAGVHNTGTRTSTSPWPVRNQATQQEVSRRPVSEASSVFTAAPHRSAIVKQSSSRKTSSGLPLILHYGDLHNYFIMYHSVIIIKSIIDKITLNHHKPICHPGLCKNYLRGNQFLMPKVLGTAGLEDCFSVPLSVFPPENL